MNSVTFYDDFSCVNSYKDLGLLLIPRKIPKPTPKTNYVDIPGGDGSLDLSEVVAGEVKYNDYVIPFEFHVIDEDLDWDSKVSEIANLLNGKKKNIIISSDLDYYYVGVRCEVSEFSSNKRLGNITINCLVKPYKLKRNITINSYEINTEGKAEGENITLTDSSNMPFKEFIVCGRSVQDGTPTPDTPVEIESVGYENLWNLDLSLTNNSASSKWVLTDASVSIPAGTYTFSSVITGSSSFTLNYKYADNLDHNTSINSKATLTFTEEVKKIAILLNANSSISNIQLEKGSIAHSYIPFGKYGIEVKTVGKNLLKYPYYETTKTLNGITFIDNGDGSITINGIATEEAVYYLTNSSYWNYNKDNLLYLPKGTYTISSTGNSNVNIYTNFYGENGTNLPMTLNNTSSKTITLTENSTGNIRIVIPKGKTINNVTVYPMIEKGSIATEYEPYQEQTTLIVLNEPLRSLPNGVKDIAYIKNNKLYVDRYIGSVVLKGADTEGWSLQTEGFNVPVTSLNIKTKSVLLSKYYKNYLTYNDLINKDYGIGMIYSSVKALYVRNIDITTLDDFKTWLSQNNVQVDYELAEPITEEVGDIKELTSYKDVTHIYSTNEVSPYFDITYQKTPEKIEIENDRMSVIPKITCEEDSIITFKDNSYSLSAGTHEIPDVQFKQGINNVELYGTGTVTFEFQEGSM